MVSSTREYYNMRDGQFDECEFCGVKTIEHISSKYYKHHDKILCDRCVDKLNSHRQHRSIDEYWLPKDARDCGYPEFPYNKLSQWNDVI